jgi:hypothetical protein
LLPRPDGWHDWGDEGSGRLLIPLPWVKPEFGSQYGGPLVSPEGWPQLPPPELGETLAAFWDRAIGGDPFLQLITPFTSDRRPVPSLDEGRPADLTLAWWEKKWPYKVFDRSWDDSSLRGYHCDRVYWRLVVELIDRLRGGDLVMKGYRTDASESDDSGSLLEPVRRTLLQNPFMVLCPRAPGGGWFRPGHSYGSEPPSGLPWYHKLTLWPAEAKREKTPAASPEEPPPRHRRSGLDFSKSDAPLVTEIMEGVKSGRFRSVWSGCREVAPKAKGSEIGDSKAHRLNRRIRRIPLSTQRNEQD